MFAKHLIWLINGSSNLSKKLKNKLVWLETDWRSEHVLVGVPCDRSKNQLCWTASHCYLILEDICFWERSFGSIADGGEPMNGSVHLTRHPILIWIWTSVNDTYWVSLPGRQLWCFTVPLVFNLTVAAPCQCCQNWSWQVICHSIYIKRTYI